MPHRGWKALVLGASGSLVVIGMPARAQTIQGTVRDSLTALPVAGAVITAGSMWRPDAGAALTDARGHFRFHVPPADSWLVVRRLGYEPRRIPLPVPIERDSDLQITLAPLPTLIAAQRTTAVADHCPSDSTRLAALRLFEDARAGLMSVVVAAREAVPSARTITIDQIRGPRGVAVRQQTVHTSTGGAHPFAAAGTPEAFAADGYMREQEGQRVFYAPDAAVLLSDAFVASHCMSLAPADDRHPGDLGLAFTPSSRPDTTVDIAGVIWLHQHPPALDELTFTYTKLEPAARDVGSGGYVHFTTAGNGAQVVDRWHLRTAQVRQPRSTDPIPPQYRRTDRVAATVTRVRDVTGSLLEATWPDGTHWTASEQSVHGLVIGAYSHQPVENAEIRITGTDLHAVTDDRGSFQLSGLPPATYDAQLLDSALYAISGAGLQAVKLPIAGAAKSAPPPLRLLYTGHRQAARAICGANGPAVVVGQVTSANGVPGDDVQVVAAWSTSADSLPPRPQREGRTDAEGRFAFCAVPSRVAVRLEARPVDRRPAAIVLRLNPSEALRTATIALPPARPRVLGLYDASTGAPIQDADVTELSTGHHATTSVTGTVSLGFLTADTAMIRIRKLGYMQTLLVVTAGPDDSVPITEILPATVALSPVVTRASRSQSLAGFDARRRRGFGTFLTPHQLAGEPRTRLLEDVLDAHGIQMASGRQGTFEGTCMPGVVIDGVPADRDLVQYVLARTTAQDWSAVEFYAGPSEVPTELNTTANAGCGLLMLWSAR